MKREILKRLLCLALALACHPAGAAVGTVPAGGSSSAGSGPGGIAGTNTYFQNFWTKVVTQKPKRIGCLGDSVGYLTMFELETALAGFYGRSGVALDGGNQFGVQALNSTATNVTRYTNWYRSYWDLGAAGQLTCSNSFNLWTYGNLLGCEFLNQTNGGTFKLQLATNGGAFADVLTGIATGTAGNNFGNFTNVGMLPGYYAARVIQTAGGLVSIIGVDLWDTNSPGVRISTMNNAGSTILDMTNTPAAVATNVFRGLGLDLLIFEGTTDVPISSSPGAFAALLAVWRQQTNMDIVMLGTPPVDSSYAFDYAGFNANMSSAVSSAGGAASNIYYFDQSTVSGSFANMQAHGLAGDGLHRTNLLNQLFASALMQTMGIGQSTADATGPLLASGHLWSGTNVLSNTVIVAGSSSYLAVQDRNAVAGTPGTQLILKTVNGVGQLSLGNPALGETVVAMIHPGYGILLPPTGGYPLGHFDYPWLLTGTNIVDTSRVPILGAGNGNTNYTILADKRRMWMGSSNVSISAVMNYAANYVYPWTVYVTNRSPDTWGIRFSEVTNRWRFLNEHTGGTNAPGVLTNGAMLRLEGESEGTNTFIRWFSEVYP